MKNLRIRSQLAALALGGTVLLSGCATTGGGSPIDSLAQNDIAKTAITGAAIGAVLGGVIGNNVGDGDAQRGAAIGAVVGGLGGAALGKMASDRRQQYETESEFLDTEVASTQNAITTKEAQLQQAQNELSQTQTQVASLEERSRNNENVAAEAKAKSQELTQTIAAYDNSLQSYQNAINYIEEVLANSQPKPGEDPVALEAKQASLTERKTVLVAQYNQLNGIKSDTQIALNSVNTIAQG